MPYPPFAHLSSNTHTLARRTTEEHLNKVDYLNGGAHASVSKFHAVLQFKVDGSLWVFDCSEYGSFRGNPPYL